MKAFYLVHIASVNNDNFASSFKIVTYLNIFANTLRTLLNDSCDNGHSLLIPDFNGSDSTFSTLC